MRDASRAERRSIRLHPRSRVVSWPRYYLTKFLDWLAGICLPLPLFGKDVPRRKWSTYPAPPGTPCQGDSGRCPWPAETTFVHRIPPNPKNPVEVSWRDDACGEVHAPMVYRVLTEQMNRRAQLLRHFGKYRRG